MVVADRMDGRSVFRLPVTEARRVWSKTVWMVGSVLVIAACTGDPSPEPEDGAAPTGAVFSTDDAAGDITDVGVVEQGRVSVTATQLEPDTAYLVAQCEADPATEGSPAADVCDMSAHLVGRSDSNGELTQQLRVFPVLGVATRREVSCLAPPADEETACVVGVVDVEERVIATAALPSESLPPEAPPPPTLALTITDLPEEGPGSAEVTGSGFPANGDVILAQCPGDATARTVDAQDCLYDQGTRLQADANGSVQGEVTVFRRFQRSDGAFVDCGLSPETCLIADPWPTVTGTRMTLVPFGG